MPRISSTSYSYRHRFPDDLQRFLAHLRDVYPNAYIVCIYGMMGLDQNINKGIQSAVRL